MTPLNPAQQLYGLKSMQRRQPPPVSMNQQDPYRFKGAERPPEKPDHNSGMEAMEYVKLAAQIAALFI